jgi:hypothetical protein
MKKSIKKYVGGVPELMTPRMASVKTADVPLVSGTPKQVSIAEQPGFSFKDKAGAFMNKNAGMITQAAGTIMPLLMKKADANARPYKTGTKNLNNNMKRKKYDEGTTNLSDNPKFKNFMAGDIRKGGGGATPEASEGPRVSSVEKQVEGRKPIITYKKGDFNSFTAEEKKKYREGIASGKEFSIGDRKYAATSKKQTTSTPSVKENKPLIKMKSSKSADVKTTTTTSSSSNKSTTPTKGGMTGKEMVLMNKKEKDSNPFNPFKPKDKEVVKTTSSSNVVKKDNTMGPLISKKKEVVVEAKRNPINAIKFGPMISDTTKNRETRMPRESIGVAKRR